MDPVGLGASSETHPTLAIWVRERREVGGSGLGVWDVAELGD